MRLIVGLGNPGKKYQDTRHGVGFMVLNKVVEKRGLTPFRLENQFAAEITQTGGLGETRVIFAKPQTYMNKSGQAVAKISHYYKIGTDDILEIRDDLDLPLGTIRKRTEISSGGHKGSESVTASLGSQDRMVLKIGIDSPKEKNILAEDYVLQRFTAEEKKKIVKVIDKAAEEVLGYIDTGIFKEETISVK